MTAPTRAVPAGVARAADRLDTLILHAFDARNRGDGFLVSETVDLVRRAGVLGERWAVLSLAPESFDAVPDVRAVPGSQDARARAALRASMSLGGALGMSLSGGRVAVGEIPKLVANADLLVGVGGGYLRAGGGYESRLTAAFHLPQLMAAAAADAPSVYLPQSVGPLRGVVGRTIRHVAARLTWIGLRDDSSVDELGTRNAQRMPDLAALAAARRVDAGPIGPRGRRIALVSRRLDLPGFDGRIRELARALDAVWGVHSDALGQHDVEHVRAVGGGDTRPTAELFEDHDVGVVVSVRLHGALQALIAGVPAIHLSYERKGFGAYDDLGLRPFVHHAATFDPGEVAAQATMILDDPDVYWEAVRRQLPRLLEADGRLLGLLAGAR